MFPFLLLRKIKEKLGNIFSLLSFHFHFTFPKDKHSYDAHKFKHSSEKNFHVSPCFGIQGCHGQFLAGKAATSAAAAFYSAKSRQGRGSRGSPGIVMLLIEKLFLAAVFEFVYIITALIFSRFSQLTKRKKKGFGPTFNKELISDHWGRPEKEEVTLE